MNWADAVVWHKVDANMPAVQDPRIKALLFHIHYAQYAYLQQWKGLPFDRLKADDFASLDAIYSWMRPHYQELLDFVGATEESSLSAPMILPWAKYYGRQLDIDPKNTTLGETMLHLSCHGIHHRAQLNTLLRTLDVETPLIDYIAWLWLDRPAASWVQGSIAS